MFTEKIEKAFNQQLKEEFFSSYLYLSIATYFDSKGLQGFANWMKVQAEEEHFHAMKIFGYIQERGGRVILEQIDKPQSSWESTFEAFESTLAHEQYITGKINDLMNLAFEERDHASISFLQWFIDEQVEEESSVNDILDKLKLIGNDGNAIFMLDKELGARVFTPPVQQ